MQDMVSRFSNPTETAQIDEKRTHILAYGCAVSVCRYRKEVSIFMSRRFILLL